MKLSELRDKPTRITVEWQGETADMEVYPGRLTQEMFEDITQAEKVEEVNEGVAYLVEWWDIIDDGGNQLPVDAETVRMLPLPLLRAICMRIFEVGTDEGKASRGG